MAFKTGNIVKLKNSRENGLDLDFYNEYKNEKFIVIRDDGYNLVSDYNGDKFNLTSKYYELYKVVNLPNHLFEV